MYECLRPRNQAIVQRKLGLSYTLIKSHITLNNLFQIYIHTVPCVKGDYFKSINNKVWTGLRHTVTYIRFLCLSNNRAYCLVCKSDYKSYSVRYKTQMTHHINIR